MKDNKNNVNRACCGFYPATSRAVQVVSCQEERIPQYLDIHREMYANNPTRNKGFV